MAFLVMILENFIQHYKDKEIMSFDPFQTIDQTGV